MINLITAKVSSGFSAFTLLCLLAFSPLANAQYFDCDEELFPRQDKQTKLYGYVNFIGEQRVPASFIRAFPFEGKYAIVQQGKKYGVLNCNGRLTVPAVYDGFLSFVNGKGWARTGELWGLVDQTGRNLIAPTYEQAIEVNPRGEYTWVSKADKWGLISKENGRFIVPLEYDTYSNMSDSAGIVRKGSAFSIVYYGDGRKIYSDLKSVRKVAPELYIFQKNDGKYGVVTSLAYTLIRPEYDSLFLHQGLFYTKMQGKWGIRNLRGAELVANSYEHIGLMHDGLAEMRKNGLYAWLNIAGKETESPSYTFADNPKSGLSIVAKGGKMGVYAPLSKKWILPLEFDKAYRNANEGLFFMIKNGKGHLYDLLGKQLTALAVDSVCIYDNKSAMRYHVSGKWGLLDVGIGKSLTTTAFDSIAQVNLGIALVKSGTKYGIINEKGTEIIPARYEQVRQYLLNKNWFFTLKNGNWALYDASGKAITGPDFQLIAPTGHKLMVAVKKGKYGAIDVSGNEVLPFQFDFLSNHIETPNTPEEPLIFSKGKKSGLISTSGKEIFTRNNVKMQYCGAGLFAFQENGKWGLVQQGGKILAEPTWDAVGMYTEKMAPAQLNGLFGFINLNGKWVVQPKFSEVLPPQGNLIFVKDNNKWGALNLAGKQVIKPTFSSYSTGADGKIKLIE